MERFFWWVGLGGACVVGGVTASHMSLGTGGSFIYGLGVGALYSGLTWKRP